MVASCFLWVDFTNHQIFEPQAFELMGQDFLSCKEEKSNKHSQLERPYGSLLTARFLFFPQETVWSGVHSPAQFCQKMYSYPLGHPEPHQSTGSSMVEQ